MVERVAVMNRSIETDAWEGGPTVGRIAETIRKIEPDAGKRRPDGRKDCKDDREDGRGWTEASALAMGVGEEWGFMLKRRLHPMAKPAI